MTSKPPFDGEVVRLGELVESSKAKNKDGLFADVYSVTNSHGFVPSQEYFNKEVYSKELRTYRVVHRNMISYNPSRINVGSVAVQDKVDNAIVSPLYVVFSADETKVIPGYLVRFLRSKPGLDQIAQQSIGTVRSNLKFDALCKMQMPLPSLQAQVERMNKLTLVEQLADGCENYLSHLDELVKSRFVEMFGDPASNPKRFPAKPGSELFRLGNGKTKPVSQRFNNGVPAYGGNGITWYTDEAMTSGPTIVLGRVGRHCGNARLVIEPCWVTDNAMYIKNFYDSSLDFIYLINLMSIVKFNRYADEGDLWKITQRPFMEFEFPLPPLALQHKFSAFVQRVDKLRFVVIEFHECRCSPID